MIVCGLPFVAKEPLKTLRTMWRDFRVFGRGHAKRSDAGLVLVYFSYEPDFEYLVLSLKSLAANKLINLKAVYLFVDSKAPFGEAQIARLRDLSPLLRVRSIENFSWASAESTHAEIQAFSEVSRDGFNANDYMVKVDSDILFLGGSRKLAKIQESGLAAVGDERFARNYMQGGLYFISFGALRQHILPATLDQIKGIEKRFNKTGEDLVITELLREGGVEPCFTRLMLFKHDYLKLSRVTGLTRSHFCGAHFIKDKERMTALFGKLVSDVC
ncbi:hypothetical protein [Pseudomaricurvus sp. HS19]|uniref:hypothetical protein n=1 Tax=Pseudomaricurvus sp. HS19 TaxID=2692626 RepID=UPI0013685CD6|nr:hypothetical protein [Pseudomaricurvus sp. HS19]MYM62038.1 hypothetical protein [Pseudomaricurvus sp. HS19]